MSRVGSLAGMLMLALTGCATLRRPPPPAVATDAGPVRVELEEWDEGTRDLVVSVLPDAAQPITRWGKFEEAVRIVVVNAHWELEEKAGRKLPGISAWATRNQVVLHDPKWWPMPPSVENEPALAAEVRRKVVTQLLTHELTHCLMFQLAGPTPSEPRDRIPFWFREGMAMLTAGEGAQWPPPQGLGAWMSRQQDRRLLARGNAIPRSMPLPVAYGAAFHGFAQLDAARGDRGVLELLEAMRTGAPFSAAFRTAYGIDEAQFTAAFDASLASAPAG